MNRSLTTLPTLAACLLLNLVMTPNAFAKPTTPTQSGFERCLIDGDTYIPKDGRGAICCASKSSKSCIKCVGAACDVVPHPRDVKNTRKPTAQSPAGAVRPAQKPAPRTSLKAQKGLAPGGR